jgi:hypothetical protein
VQLDGVPAADVASLLQRLATSLPQHVEDITVVYASRMPRFREDYAYIISYGNVSPSDVTPFATQLPALPCFSTLKRIHIAPKILPAAADALLRRLSRLEALFLRLAASAKGTPKITLDRFPADLQELDLYSEGKTVIDAAALAACRRLRSLNLATPG